MNEYYVWIDSSDKKDGFYVDNFSQLIEALCSLDDSIIRYNTISYGILED